MFSSLFGKRRSSPVEAEDEAPPIPGPKPDDGFVVVEPGPPGNSLYPNVSGTSLPYPFPQRPAPPAPPATTSRTLVDPTFHYLQGVPFALSKTLQLASNKDGFATEISDLLAFLKNKVNVSSYDYDFSVEKSVLKEDYQ